MERNANVAEYTKESRKVQHYQEDLQMAQHVSSNSLNELVPDENVRNTISVSQNIEGSANDDNNISRESMKARRRNRKNRTKEWRQQSEKLQNQQCQVCFNFYDKNDVLEFGKCGHKYCKKCLSQHINNSIANFQITNCLEEGCSQTLDFSSPHIQSLAVPQQEKYYKITVFLNLSKNQSTRMCPTVKCEGILKMSKTKFKCPICGISFCKLCMLPKHKGKCDQNGALYMMNNFHFRQCERCKMVLERNKGCDHMTCKCGHQFCYLCGEQWFVSHKCQPKTQIVRPFFLPSPIYGIRNTLPPLMRRPQPQQRENIRQQLPRPNPPPSETSCCGTLKNIAIIILLIPFHFIIAQIFFPILILLIVPIVSPIFFVFYSLVVGMREMYQNQSCRKMILLNIFIYLYYVILCFCRKCSHFFMNRYRRNIVTLENLFPITYSFVYLKVRN